MDDDDPHFQKLSIPWATISSLIQRAISSPSDIDGLLFGHATRSLPSSLSDAPTPADPTPLLTANITSFLSSPSPPPSVVLLLISASASLSPSIHTHEYRAFQLRPGRSDGGLCPVLESVSLDVINIGPAFRGHYGSFCPSSPFPWLPFGAAAAEVGGAESLTRMKRASKDMDGAGCVRGGV